MSRPTNEPPLYTPLGFAMVRAPLLPVEAYSSLRSRDDAFVLLGDPRVRRAVAAGSLSLLSALDRFERSALTRRDTERLMAKLLRYEIRMSTRPTPYGLFAGCASVAIGDRTNLSIRATFGACRTRPDMAWLMQLVKDAETAPGIRRRLRLIRNPLIRLQGDRISLPARTPAGRDGGVQPVSARATAVVGHALELAASPIDYTTLATRLREASPGATPDKVDRLLTELCEQTFLLTDLRPPLTTESPARYVLNRLSAIPEAAAVRERLDRMMRLVADWDRVAHEESVSALRTILAEAGNPEDGSKEAPVQVDLGLSVEGRLGSIVAAEAARAAELLIRLSPSPRGLSSLAAYRNAFLARYGQEREVGLLELLDPDRGLGSVAAHGHAYVGPDAAAGARRSAALLACACSALHARQRVVHLDEKTLEALDTWESRPERAPLSLDINILVAAPGAKAIDTGEFLAVVGPNLGAWAAGRNFGRFAHLHGPEGVDLLRSAASREEADHLQDRLWVEVVFLPSNVRSANVAIRPPIRPYEVVFGVSPGVPDSNVVPLGELVVGLDEGRFYVRWPAAGKRLQFVSGHMLNPHGAPAVAQFLMQVSHDATIAFTSFDWGPAEGFPFLPRVQAGRVVLRPAEWKISKETLGPDEESVGVWRHQWDVPRRVALTVADNRLVLDLDRPDQVRELLTESARLAGGQSLTVQEVVPSLEEAWLEGPEGHYVSEFVVPLVRRPSTGLEATERAPAAAEAEAPAAAGHEPGTERRDLPAPTVQRRHPPGSAWLFVKVYGPGHREDALIADSLEEFAANVLASELADSWFFIRYADPEGHIRVRFHGDPDRLSGRLFGHVCRWAQGLMDAGACSRFVFDTYDQEVERFGGPDGMSVAEQLFCADSRAAAGLVKVLRRKEWAEGDDRTALLALTIDDLLAALAFDESRRLDWYATQTAAAGDRDVGGQYRRMKTILRHALGDPTRWLRSKPFGDRIEAALDQRARDVAGPARMLRQLSSDGRLSQSIEALAVSYVHLQLNRLGAAAGERLLLGILLRTRRSLAKAPVGG